MAVVVGIVDEGSLGIDMHHGNQPSKSKLVPYNLIYCNSP